MKELPHILIVWDGLPCLKAGAGIILRRLLDVYPADRLWALTASYSPPIAKDYDPIPPASQQETVLQFIFPHRFVDRVAGLLNAMMIPWIVGRGVRLAREKSVDAILTVPWSPFFVAAYFIHRRTGIPLHVYIMDDHLGGKAIRPVGRFLYRRLMPRILRAAKTVWGVSPYMCEYFEQAYGVRCQPLLPFLDVEEFSRACRAAPKAPNHQVHVAYTGAIYTAQLDALRNLVEILNGAALQSGANGRAFRLTLYTDHPEQGLKRMGLQGPGIRRAFVKTSEMPRALAGADILFLPFSFAPEMRHIVSTSLPTKIVEYLASGVPMLVHAPPYSSVARYCREFECGLVVDEPDQDKLREALLALATDKKLREELSARALETARKNHDLGRNSPRFLEQISS